MSDTLEFNKWKAALAMTESTNNDRAWGDEGLAVGRWQMHPAFVWDFGPDDVAVRESWDALFADTLLNFYATRAPHVPDPVKLAMEFHLGLHAVAEGQWDQVYADRFQGFYA